MSLSISLSMMGRRRWRMRATIASACFKAMLDEMLAYVKPMLRGWRLAR